jgi:hypothetical protein
MTLGPPVRCQHRSGLDRRVRHPVLTIEGPDQPPSPHLRDRCPPRQALVAPLGARQIPIAPAELPQSRAFLPWRLSNAGPVVRVDVPALGRHPKPVTSLLIASDWRTRQKYPNKRTESLQRGERAISANSGREQVQQGALADLWKLSQLTRRRGQAATGGDLASIITVSATFCRGERGMRLGHCLALNRFFDRPRWHHI